MIADVKEEDSKGDLTCRPANQHLNSVYLAIFSVILINKDESQVVERADAQIGEDEPCS